MIKIDCPDGQSIETKIEVDGVDITAGVSAVEFQLRVGRHDTASRIRPLPGR